MVTVLMGILEGSAPLRMFASRGRPSEIERDEPQRTVSYHEESWVLLTLGRSQELLP